MHLHLTASYSLDGIHEDTVSVAGDVLTVDGIDYDLSAIPEGGEATPEGLDHPFRGKITREGGVIHATVRVRMANTADLREVADWTIPNASGAITIPAARKPEPEAAE